MSAALAMIPQQRSASDDVLELLAALHPRTLRGRARCLVGRGLFLEELSWQPSTLPAGCWPSSLLVELAGSDPRQTPRDVRLGPATVADDGSLLDARVAWVELDLGATFDGAKRGRGWHVPEAAEQAALARLRACPLQPSLIVHQGWSLWAGWLLGEPLRLDRGPGLARLERAQRDLAEALGGIVAAVAEPGRYAPRTLPGWSPARCSLRMPSSRNHDTGGAEGGRVRLLELAPERTFGLDELLKLSSGKAAA